MTRRLNVRNLLALVIFALAGALTIVVAQNFRGGAPEEILEALPSDVDLSLRQINYTETEEGRPRWTLVADSASHSVEESVTRIENIHMTFYDEEMGDVTLTADSGEMLSDSRNVTVRGNVEVKTPRGYALYTDELRYLEAQRLIRTGKPVRLVSEQMEVTGAGMVLDVQKRTLTLLSDVEALLAAPADDGDN